MNGEGTGRRLDWGGSEGGGRGGGGGRGRGGRGGVLAAKHLPTSFIPLPTKPPSVHAI